MPRDDLPANTYAQSLAAVLAACRPPESEPVPFREALGRVLAADLLAAADDPPAPKSAMDGFALLAETTGGATPERPQGFAYTEVIGAGHVASGALPPGGAVRIMTGALLPEGADAVVKLEDTLREDTPEAPTARGEFRITAPLRPGENVFGPGSRFARGDRLVAAGAPLAAQAVGLIAGQGLAEIACVRRPRVALLALGDELAEPGRPLPPGGLYVSNLYALEAEARRQGGDTRNLGIAPDDPGAIAAALQPQVRGTPAAPAADLVVTLGGSHRGDFDFIGDVWERLGARTVFQRTLINWGGSTLFAVHEDARGATLCFGLPGTPLASWLAFELLVRPALWRLAGRHETARPLLRARLAAAVKRRPGRQHFLPVRLEFSAEGLPLAVPLGERPSDIKPTSLLADGLILFPENAERLPEGHEVTVAWLGG